MSGSSFELINVFLETLTIEDGLSRNTIESYHNDLKLFDQFIKKQNKSLEKTSKTLIRLYIKKLNDDRISPTSIVRKISSIKRFFNFLDDENYIDTNPSLNIGKPKITNRLPKSLSEKEVLTLLETVNKDQSDFGVRLSCMLEILYASGLRVSELVSLPISSIEKEQDNKLKNYLIISGKGRKERLVPLNRTTIKILEKYLQCRKGLGQKQSKWLFCGHFRANKKANENRVEKKFNIIDKPITRQRFHQMLKELAIKANIDQKRVSPHIIRHSFATHLLDRGIDLRTLQELLGHSDISTTQIYTHIANKKLKDLLHEKHPLAKER